MILPRPVDVMIPCCKDRLQFALAVLDSKQALLGALLAEREKEEELATTSLEFEYLHRKRRCEMLTGGDDNDLSRVFQCLFTFTLVPVLR